MPVSRILGCVARDERWAGDFCSRPTSSMSSSRATAPLGDKRAAVTTVSPTLGFAVLRKARVRGGSCSPRPRLPMLGGVSGGRGPRGDCGYRSNGA